MAEFIAGLSLCACGAALIVHNETLVRRSLEFLPAARREKEAEILFNRVLCVLAGVITLATGLLMILIPGG